jgi:hypothetical protein
VPIPPSREDPFEAAATMSDLIIIESVTILVFGFWIDLLKAEAQLHIVFYLRALDENQAISNICAYEEDFFIRFTTSMARLYRRGPKARKKKIMVMSIYQTSIMSARRWCCHRRHITTSSIIKTGNTA